MGPLRTGSWRALARACTALVAVAVLLLAVAAATGAMRSTKLGPRLCETTGGGRFVSIPGFPGEKIDRRLLRDIRFLKRRWPIFITDGYSLDPVHSRNGEHPIGLALDIVPNRAEGGRWRHITKLANWAEPTQNHPRAPFRWVGYAGDAGHGPRHHLHLSWSHSPTPYNDPARKVWTIRCPDRPDGDSSSRDGESSGGSGPSGGISSDSSGTTSGGIGTRTKLAPIQRESGGISAR